MNNIKKYKVNSSITIIIAVVIVILINVFVTVLGTKVPLKIDMTTNKMFEISEKTKEYLKNYETPVDIYVLAGNSEKDERINAVLRKYSESNSNIKITNINTAENPTFGRKYANDGIKLTANSVIVDSGNKYKLLSLSDLYGINAQTGSYTSLNVENKITSALKYVSSDNQLKAYVVQGHNELAVSGAMAKLEDENYSVAELNTLTEEIPADTSLLMIVRPTADFSKDEISKLDSYLLSGGNMQIYFDVDSKGLTNLYDYLKSVWGIGVEDNMVIETDTSHSVMIGGNGVTLVVPEIRETEFTSSLLKNKRTIAYFPYSKELRQEFEHNGDISVEPVLLSSDKAYVTTSNIAEKTGAESQFIVGALAGDNKHNSSVYVSGNTMLLTRDASILSNDYGLANYDYFMNLINYTLNNDESFTVDEKTLVNNSISMSLSSAVTIFILVVIIIPLIILVCGLVIWFRRRNL